MAVGVDAPAEGGREGLAAVVRLVLRHTQHVQVLPVARIDADLAEIHGPRIDAVDADPGVASVAGLEQAARLVAVGSLLGLDVLLLAAEPGAVRSPRRRPAPGE